MTQNNLILIDGNSSLFIVDGKEPVLVSEIVKRLIASEKAVADLTERLEYLEGVNSYSETLQLEQRERGYDD